MRILQRSYPIALLLTALAASSSAAMPEGRAEDARARLARYYEDVATRALGRYYTASTFLVRAKVRMADDGASIIENQVEVPEPEPTRLLPQLPGLPALPDGYQIDPFPPQAAAEEMQSVTLEVLVDTGYTLRDRDFIQSLLAMEADLDAARGDQVVLEKTFFPRDTREIRVPHGPENAQQPSNAVPPQPETATAPAEPSQAPAPTNPFQSYVDNLPSLLPLGFLGLVLLGCVWMISQAISGRRPRPATGIALPAAPAPPPTEAVRAPDPPRASQAAAETPARSDASQRTFLLNCFVGNPRLCAQILRSWVLRDRERGIREAAMLVSGTGHRLTGILVDSLGKETARSIDLALSALDQNDPETFAALGAEFRREFLNLSIGQPDARQEDLFGFLNQLNEQQIIHILRDESLGIAAMAIAQLPPDRAGSLLQKMNPDNRARLLVGMGSIDSIPFGVYKEIAERLSQKALELANMRFVAADGVETILGLIDNLPVAQQHAYIQSISEMDLNLARKIRARFVTFPELATLPDKFLAGRIQSLDQETLGTALQTADEQLRGKVMSVLPERMQLMVQSTIDGRRNATPEEVDAAQRKLLKAVREEMRAVGRPA